MTPDPTRHDPSHKEQAMPTRATQHLKAAVADAEGALQSTVDDLRERAPAAFSRAAAQVEELTRRSVERARDAGYQVRDRVGRAGDMTVGYIRDEPMKSVLIAAATGAAVAMLIGWLARSNHARHPH
jgi:ElaB/YqjD/DUF883 family membrane-anchored ribosome-binding protein